MEVHLWHCRSYIFTEALHPFPRSSTAMVCIDWIHAAVGSAVPASTVEPVYYFVYLGSLQSSNRYCNPQLRCCIRPASYVMDIFSTYGKISIYQLPPRYMSTCALCTVTCCRNVDITCHRHKATPHEPSALDPQNLLVRARQQYCCVVTYGT